MYATFALTSRGFTTPMRPTSTPLQTGFWPGWRKGPRCNAAASCPAQPPPPRGAGRAPAMACGSCRDAGQPGAQAPGLARASSVDRIVTAVLLIDVFRGHRHRPDAQIGQTLLQLLDPLLVMAEHQEQL